MLSMVKGYWQFVSQVFEEMSVNSILDGLHLIMVALWCFELKGNNSMQVFLQEPGGHAGRCCENEGKGWNDWDFASIAIRLIQNILRYSVVTLHTFFTMWLHSKDGSWRGSSISLGCILGTYPGWTGGGGWGAGWVVEDEWIFLKVYLPSVHNYIRLTL